MIYKNGIASFWMTGNKKVKFENLSNQEGAWSNYKLSFNMLLSLFTLIII
jgi:hypothetical protein